MAVSQDIQDYCAALPGRVQAAVQSAVATAEAQHASELQALQDKFDNAMARAQQDHADEVAALQAALDASAPPSA